MAHLKGNNTHVANATREKIFARVAENKPTQVKRFGGGVNLKVGGFGGGAQGQTEYFKAELLKDGFVAIGAGDYLAFHTEKHQPYVSVYKESGNQVCENYRPGKDISIIVTAEETIKQTMYGKIWVDTDGKRHC